MAVNIERSVVTVGKRAIIPEDVVNVAARDFQVVIEKVVLDEINEATAKQAFVQSEWPETGGHAAAAHAVDLPPESAREELHHAIVCLRAALFVRIIALLQPPPPASKYRTRVRAPILCYLTDMLNKGVYPTAALELVRHDQSDVQSRLMSLFFKDGPVFGSDQSLFQRRQCEELQITAPPPLSQQERELLCLGLPTFVTAVAALTLCSLRALLDTADAVASLSCEALQAHKKPFDSVYHEQSRPHKGEMRSLSNVRAMHEATKNLDARSAVKEQDPAFVCEFVSIHGTARTATDAALTAVQVDLNSVVVGPFGDGKDAPGPISAQPVIAATVGALSAFSGLLRFSNGRRTLVNSQVEDHQRLSPTASCAHAATTAVDSTATAAGTASSDLGFTDPAVFARALAPAITALLDPTSNDSNGVVAAFRATRLMHHCLVCECRSTLLAIDLRERVIVERQQQRLAAAEASGRGRGKAPPPAAAKSEAGGSAKGLGLGKGSEIVRSFLSQQLRGADRSALDRILDPLNPSFDFSAFLVNVFAGNAEHRLPKIPRGTRDFMPLQMNIREFAFNIITSVFKAHGAQTIDTPVFELKETLTGKYGEDSKLIYDLADQGGELLALRYDLTVPFARFVAMNKLERMKRYHISRVYRRDTPNPNKGRYREFFQCDFDIAGVYDPMVPDAEALKVLTEILTALPLGCNFIVKINHRKLLDAIMAVSGVPDHKFRTICSSIDKLDKEEWETVRREMVDEKGLSCAAAESIGRFVQRRGNPFQLLEALQDSTLRSNESAMRAFDDLEKLFGYLERSYNVLHHFCFDLSLARGLDYYTGIIYEAVLTDSTSSLGSIAGGGRYDDLVGIFSPTGKKIPAVGVSIGIERIFDLMEKELIRSHRLRKSETEVLVGSIGTIPMEQRMMLCNQLWAEGIKAEHGYQAAHKDWRSQTEYMKERDIPFMICLSPEDSQKHAAQLKTLGQKETESVPLGHLVQRVRELVVEFRRNPVVTTQLEAPPSAVATATASTVATATASTAATATSSTATTASL